MQNVLATNKIQSVSLKTIAIYSNYDLNDPFPFFSFILRLCAAPGTPLTPSNPVYPMALYEAMADSIAICGTIKKNFMFVANRKKETKAYFRDGVPKFKVSNKVHMIKLGIDCRANQNFANDSLTTIEDLTSLSRSNNGHQFMVFFSTIEQGVARCLVVNSSDEHPANNFWSAIRFGRVMEVTFCTKGTTIISHRVKLRTMN